MIDKLKQIEKQLNTAEELLKLVKKFLASQTGLSYSKQEEFALETKIYSQTSTKRKKNGKTAINQHKVLGR